MGTEQIILYCITSFCDFVFYSIDTRNYLKILSKLLIICTPLLFVVNKKKKMSSDVIQ